MKKIITLCCLLFISATYAQLIAIDDVVVARADNPNPSTSNGPRIFINDYFNGTAINFGTFGNFTFTEVVPDPSGYTTLNPLGFINIAANTPQGIYYITYEICENAMPTNCDTAVIEIRIFPGSLSSGSGSSEMAISASSGNVSCGGNVCITDPFCIDLNTGTIPPLTLSATYQEIGESNAYVVNTIPFNPPFSFGDTATGTSLTTDDIWSPVINFAFDFEFYQANYSSCVLSTNGAVSFDLTNANTFHMWTPAAGALIPNNTDAALRDGNIFGAIHDTDPSASGTLGVNYNITYSIKGEAPFRVFVFSFYNVAHFSCNTLKTSQMIMFYETTNIVETYIFQKPVCASWAGGRAAIGIQNNAGNQGLSPPGRNTGVWDIPFLAPEAYQFVPSGSTITTFQWLDEAGTIIGTDPNALVVTPSQTTTYVAQVTYTDALTGVEYIAYRPITVVVSPTPVVTVAASADMCDTGDVVFTITGSENDVVEYNLNGGTTQSITIDATGTYVITITGATTTQTINLLSANNLNSVCGGPMSVSETVNIYASPTVDAPADVTACNDYTLPALTSGDYYTATGGPGGTGTMLNAGDVITTTQTIYVYGETGTVPNCFDENSFVVTINICTLSVSASADMPTICHDAGVDVTLTATPSPGTAVGTYSYSWNVQGNATVLGTNATLVLSPPPVATTIYEVTLTDSGLAPPNDTATNTVTVTVNTTPTVDAPTDVTACDNYILPALGSGTYYTGVGGTGTVLNAGDSITTTQTIYVYEETGTTPNCFDENSFVVTINTTPVVDAPTDVTACDSYVLPALTGGDYYNGPGGTGGLITAGTSINSSQTIYVYEETGTTPNCFAENSFVVTINTTPIVDNPAAVTACNEYALPALTNGNYYTGTGGTGTMLNAGDLITTSQTIYVFEETATTPNCFAENSFVVTINVCTISVTATADMLSICNDAGADVTLSATPSPGTAVGTYSYSWNVQGNATVLGTNATLLLSPPPATTTTYEVTLTDSGLTPPNDTATNTVTVVVNTTPTVDAPTDVTVCDTYVLPALTSGQYYNGPGGTGGIITVGTSINSTQTIYVYEETGTTPNCFDENSFVVTINTTPVVDAPADVTMCDSYTLPALTNGTYYTGIGGTGAMLNAGDSITSTQTIYVYAETGTTPNCFSENSFVVTINITPIVDAPADVTMCDSYTLPALTNGTYYTGIGGTGTMLNAGDLITSTQTIYVYADTGSTPNCFDENSFVVTINQTPTVDAPTDVTVCDSYTLPALTNGTYYTGIGGTGSMLNAGDSITSTQTIYVYAETGTTPNCFDENSFVVTINQTPTVDVPTDVTVCDSYTLPALTNGTYYTGIGGTGSILNAGDSITSTQTIFVYAETGTTPNCFSENSFVVTINITPVVDAPADVTMCDSYTLPALTNGTYYTGIGGTGSMLNAGDSITSTQTIYVFDETGTTPNCFAENSFVVTINQTPTVDAPSDVTACDSYVLPALTGGQYYNGPGGTGGIITSGTSINSSQTIYVYAETGTTPNCFSENSFVVTINTTPVVDAPADVTMCDSYTLPALTNGTYYTGTGGTGTVYNAGDLITSTQTIYVYAETGTTPNCSSENSFVVTINITPTVDAPTDITACDTYTLPALGNGIYYTGAGGTGTVLNSGDAITTTQTIYVYAETGTTPNCFDENSFVVTIHTTPIVDAPADVTMCVNYTLPALTNGTYYTGAGGTGTILSTGDVIASTQTIYVYAESGTTPNCFDENSFVVTINPLPTVVNPSPLIVCDDNVIDGMTEMDLTIKNNEISGGNSNYIVTYYNSLVAAIAGMPEVMPSSTAYIGTDGEVVFVRVEDANTGCFDTTTLTLNVLTGPPVATPTPLYDCDVDNDNLGTFDLSTVRDDILAVDPTLNVTFHLTLQNALDDVNPQGDSLSNVAGQIIYVRVEFGTGLDCATIVELQLIVEPAPEVPDNISPYVICDDDLDGMATFNLTTMNATIYGTQNPANYALTYHETMADAEAIPGVNPIVEPDLSNYVSGSTTIYVRLEGLNGCINVGQFDLIVNPLPQIPAEVQDGIYEICDDSSDNDGYAIFDLTTQNDGFTGGDATLVVNYFETMADIPNNPIADYTAYSNVSIGGLPHNPQTIFVTLTETTSGGSCYSVTSLTLVVNTLPTPNDVLPNLTDCDDTNSGDLQEEFDLTQNEGLMVNDFDETVTYYETLADAESGNNAINNPNTYANISTPQTIYVRVTNTGDPSDPSDNGTGCYAIITFDLIVNPTPVVDLDDLYIICINLNGTEVVGAPLMDTGLSATLYTFEWIEDGNPSIILSTSPSYMPTIVGNYTVFVTDISTGCMSSDSTTVESSSPPTVNATVATEAFANNNIIVVTATGDGAALFEFSIDNGPWLSNEPNSNTYTFSNVLFGEHVIQARDINGCGIASDIVLVMDYPLFFTPNGDGYNDTWQIFGIENQYDAKIYIFDRFGKLLKQLSPTGPGWDGTYNGELLPTSDYWFTIDYRELGESEGAQKQFKAHFTLKR